MSAIARLAVILSLIALNLSCASTPGPLVLSLYTGLGPVTLTVLDATGLVLGVRQGVHPDPSTDVVARAHPERREIEIGWMGGLCRRNPVLHVTRSGDRIDLLIRPDAGPEEPGGCRLVGITLGVVLTVDVPIAQDALRLTGG